MERPFEIIKDPDKIENFYMEVFGWPVVRRDEKTGNWIITLKEDNREPIPASDYKEVLKAHRAPTEKIVELLPPLIGQIVVDNLDNCIQKIQAIDESLVLDDKTVLGNAGQYQRCQDPAGNWFFIFEPLYWNKP